MKCTGIEPWYHSSAKARAGALAIGKNSTVNLDKPATPCYCMPYQFMRRKPCWHVFPLGMHTIITLLCMIIGFFWNAA